MSKRNADLIAQAIAGRAPNAEGWIRINCPLCIEVRGSRDNRASLGVRGDTGLFRCFRCDAKGRASGFSKTAQEPRLEAETPPVNLPSGFVLLGEGVGAEAHTTSRAREYLRNRKVSDWAVQQARIGYAEDAKGISRIVVPILDPDLGLRGWVARALSSSVVPKYLNAAGGWASKTVFNVAALRQRSQAPLLVVEGVFDALPYWPNAVAMLGKGVKGEQFQVLLTSRRPLVICYDGDAHEEGWALAARLQLFGVQAVSVRLPAATDPNTVDTHWLLSEAERAVRGGSQ